MNPMTIAISRAIVGGLLVGGSTGLATYQATNSLKAAALAGGTSCIGILIVRGGFEGTLDAGRVAPPTRPGA